MSLSNYPHVSLNKAQADPQEAFEDGILYARLTHINCCIFLITDPNFDVL